MVAAIIPSNEGEVNGFRDNGTAERTNPARGLSVTEIAPCHGASQCHDVHGPLEGGQVAPTTFHERTYLPSCITHHGVGRGVSVDDGATSKEHACSRRVEKAPDPLDSFGSTVRARQLRQRQL
jgi:hypothetical protein